jgi:hypothetical protein
MIEQGVQGNAQVALGIGRLPLSHRGDGAAEETLLGGRVEVGVGRMPVVGLHRAHIAFRVCIVAEEATVGPIGRAGARIPAPAREDLGQPLDIGMRVGLHRLPVDQPGRAIGVQFDQANREQLHDLARIVLVGHTTALRVFLLVAQVGQVQPHHRMQADVFQQRTVVAEGVGGEHVVVRSHSARVVGHRAVTERDHEDLRERKGHPLTQLVLAGHRLSPPGFEEVILADIAFVGRRPFSLAAVHVVAMQAARAAELVFDPARVAELSHRRDLDLGGTETGLVKEAGRLGVGRRPILSLNHCITAAASATSGQQEGQSRCADNLRGAPPCQGWSVHAEAP